MIRAIVVDDEAKSRKLLRNLLNTYCQNIKVVAMADCVRSALESIHSLKPDLVFLDIIMDHENAFDLLDRLAHVDFQIVFTTSYNEFAVKAFRVQALDYLIKPINVKELQIAAQRAESKLEKNGTNRVSRQKASDLIHNTKVVDGPHDQKIGLPTQHGLKFIYVKDILFCKAEGNYTRIVMANHDELVTKTLKQFDSFLLHYDFLRIHRSYLVNIDYVLEYSRSNDLAAIDGDGGYLILKNKIRLPVSREKKKVLLKHIQTLLV